MLHQNELLYISQSTQSTIKSLLDIKNQKINTNEILYPMPSINIDLLSEAVSIPTIRGINNPFIFFNSSIVERKRVELAINFFKKSESLVRHYKAFSCLSFLFDRSPPHFDELQPYSIISKDASLRYGHRLSIKIVNGVMLL